MQYPNAVAVIPAYNEEGTISRIIGNVKTVCNVIVVDDGSTDHTRSVSEKAGAIVLPNIVNKGYSYSIGAGITKAGEMGFDYAITLDADGQHDYRDIVKFFARLDENSSMVVGKRNQTQRWAEALSSVVMNLAYGIKDPLCGMKAYKLFNFKGYGGLGSYDSIGTELLFIALKNGMKVSEIPIYCPEREDGNRFGNGWRPNWRILKAIGKGLFLKKNKDGK